MKMGEYNCENHLEIYGKWDDLKKFTINNWGNQGLSFRKYMNVHSNRGEGEELIEQKSEPFIIEYEKDLFNKEMDMIYYTFLTKDDPPEGWLENISKQYNNLEFNLFYQNRKNEKSGDYLIKNGEIYYKEELAAN